MKPVYDWTKHCGSHESKEAFHRDARRLLKSLAKDLGLAAGSFDLRSNKGGSAVSGEVTLHHNDIYIQASNPGTRHATGLMIRTCRDRKDYEGGRNQFAPLSWLDDAHRPKLVKLARQVMEQKLGFDSDAKNDPSYHPLYSTPRVSR
jgi:hypothetical protein